MWRRVELVCVHHQRLEEKRFILVAMTAAVLAATLMLALRPSIPFGWKDYPIPKLARPGMVPGGSHGTTPRIWLPLPQYIHPFRGELVLKHKNWDGRSISSFAHSPKDNRCEVTITRVGSGGIGPQVWMCAFISEVATCNGAPDVNGDRRTADGGSMTFGDQWVCREAVRSHGCAGAPQGGRRDLSPARSATKESTQSSTPATRCAKDCDHTCGLALEGRITPLVAIGPDSSDFFMCIVETF
jgi:hypothetical protein